MLSVFLGKKKSGGSEDVITKSDFRGEGKRK